MFANCSEQCLRHRERSADGAKATTVIATMDMIYIERQKANFQINQIISF